MNSPTRTTAVVLALVAVSACADIRKVETSTPPLDAKVKALVEQTQKNLVPLKGGTFEMGDWGLPNGLPIDAYMDSKPLHKVTLDPFSMLKYKVTYAEFDTFTDAVGEPRINMNPVSLRRREPLFPASVSWYGANDYCHWLAKQSGMKFELPTEAQWEYAARSEGSKNYLYATDNGSLDLGRNYPAFSFKDVRYRVGKFPPNPAGFFDMSDQTVEWASDWYDKNYYSVSPEKNPKGPESGTDKIIRGANGDPETTGLVMARYYLKPKRQINLVSESALKFDTRYSDLPGLTGFRCVRN